jgi:hypothetical protein
MKTMTISNHDDNVVSKSRRNSLTLLGHEFSKWVAIGNELNNNNTHKSIDKKTYIIENCLYDQHKTKYNKIFVQPSKNTLLKTNNYTKESIFKGMSHELIKITPNPIINLLHINILEKTFENNGTTKYNINIKTSGELIIHSSPSEQQKKKLSSFKVRTIETYDTYVKNILSVALSQDLTWVYNILDGKSEADKIIFQNDNFVLLPDIQWNSKNIEEFYSLAIVKNRNIRSIRDLNQTSLPLLKDIYNSGIDTIKKKYNIDATQLRVYFHYHPSTWHLHVHFNLLKNSYRSTTMDHCHSLLNVIQNIELIPDYYQMARIEVTTVQSDM